MDNFISNLNKAYLLKSVMNRTDPEWLNNKTFFMTVIDKIFKEA